MRIFGLIVLLLFGSVGIGKADDLVCNAGHCERNVTLQSGSSAILAVGIYGSNSSDCLFVEPHIETLVQPHLGKIVPRIVSRPVAPLDHLGRPDPCAGKPTKGLQINYISDSGSHGTDEVVLNVIVGRSQAVARYVITVQ